jgi:histidinol-phosphatase (PHP family)
VGAFMLADYHIHAAAHGEYKYTREWIQQFLDTAAGRGIAEIGLSEHLEYSQLVDLALIEKISSEAKQVKVRLGLEADYIPGQEEITRRHIMARNYDYIIGSVHFINGWGFDHPDFRERFDHCDIDETYQFYFNLVLGMVQSGLYDIVGHMDLIKLWGHRSRRPISSFITPVLKAIRVAGMTVELNSAGLRKPVHELYPAESIITEMFNLDIPVTFGSDAHHPDQVGEDFNILIEAAARAGYNSIMTFAQRCPGKVLI